jgi:hypothetical protein
MWNANDAVAYLNLYVQPHSLGRCAEYVRKAVEAGGVTLVRHTSAKDYGSSLVAVGFRALANGMPMYSPGDVAVIQPITGHPHGHMTMFNGTHWISDFKQMHGLYPGPSYRQLKPAFIVYRYPYLYAGPPLAPPHTRGLA